MSCDKGSPISTPRKLKFEQLRADYELFLQTFESKFLPPKSFKTTDIKAVNYTQKHFFHR